MEAFLQSYGFWILLAGVFLAMQWLGMGCGAGHRHGSDDEERPREEGPKRPAHSGRSGGCH
jgi:hypothetical protein